MKFSEGLNSFFTPVLLGKVMGIDIYLHWSWWMMLIFLLVVGPMTASVFIGLFVLIALHELGHCWAAQRCDVQVESIMLYVTGGVARIHACSFKDDTFVTIFGPLVNLALIPLLGFLEVVTSQNPQFCHFYFERLSFLNIALLVFNLIPAYPLDGGRLLRSVLGLKLGCFRATFWAVMISSILSILVGLLGIMTGKLILVVIALFVYYAAQQELQNLQGLPKLQENSEFQRTITDESLSEIRDKSS